MSTSLRGESDLNILLNQMQPLLDAKSYVFVTTKALPTNCKPLATFVEEEGVSLVLSQSEAEQLGFDHSDTFRRITLQIHSSLHAIGLTAAVSTALTKAGISANVVAAFYHDHIFVPAEDADRAMVALKNLAL
ncbi:MAG: ACT domain-containing protein [Pseudomonadota bacterium]